MISIFTILSIAKFESKTLLRSWFFRIFTGLILFILFFLNLGMFSSVGNPSWEVIAVPSNLPYSNFTILNFFQAIIAVFLAADFLRRDKKLDTTEVIYMRSMSNADYVIGKTLGNVWVFLILNFLVGGMAFLYNVLLTDVPVLPLPYLYYILLISIPTLLFIMGLSFLLMSVIKNQALTFVLVLGYIGVTVFYLQTKSFYLFDYMGFKIPMTYSAITGFGDLKGLLLQRGMYTLFGSGFIAATIAILQRLPQKRYERPAFIAQFVVFILAGLWCGQTYYSSFASDIAKREEILQLNDKYNDHPIVSVKNYNIKAEHMGETMRFKADLRVENSQAEPQSELLFSLNPGMIVTSFEEGDIRREQNLLFLKLDKPLRPYDSKRITLSWEGHIEDWACFPEVDNEQFYEARKGNFGTSMRKYAFIEDNMVVLTQESEWYPKPGVGIGKTTWGSGVQFSKFELEVTTKDSLVAVSQGKCSQPKAGIYRFENRVPMPQISLAIANYETKSLNVDGVEMEVNYLPGHNYFDHYFENLGDTITPVLKEILNDYEVEMDIRYPYRHFKVVETPVQFASYERTITTVRSQTQPQMSFIPERGATIRGLNLKREDRRRGPQRDEEKNMTEQEKEVERLRRLVKDTWLEASDPSFSFNFSIGPSSRFKMTNTTSPYYIFPNFYNFTNTVDSKEYPVLNRVMESYIKSTRVSRSDMRASFMRNFSGSSENEDGNVELQTQSLKQLLHNSDKQHLLDNIIDLKGKSLFSILETSEEEGVFAGFIRDMLLDYRGKGLTVEDMDHEFEKEYGVTLSSMLEKWYNEKALPGYQIQNIFAEKFLDDEAQATAVSFQIYNKGTVDGVVKVTFMIGGGRRGGFGGGGAPESVTKLVSLKANEAKEVTYVLDDNPRMMMIDTYCSMNVPSSMMHRFEKIRFNKNRFAMEMESSIEASVFDPEEFEVIVDTEESGFSLNQPDVQSPLKKLLTKPNPNESKYKGMNTREPPEAWTFITNSDFYGELTRSAVYVKGGTGDKKASWTPELKKAGYYEVSVYIPAVVMNSQRRGPGGRPGGGNKKVEGEFRYTVLSDDGEEKFSVELKDALAGWNSIGTYYLSPKSAMVTLSNDGAEKMVVADAVKFSLDE